MTDKEKIREAFEKWCEDPAYSKEELQFSDVILLNGFSVDVRRSFFAGYKSRDTEVKELEEAVEEEMGHVNRLIEENNLLREALENVKAIQPLYWNMTSDNMHPEHKFALSMAGIKEACKIAQEALNKTGGE